MRTVFLVIWLIFGMLVPALLVGVAFIEGLTTDPSPPAVLEGPDLCVGPPGLPQGCESAPPSDPRP